MYEDMHRIVPPTPNPLFDYFKDLINVTDPYLRFVDGGLGTDTESKRYYSWLWGRAMCRWFLHDHLHYTYFTHISTILNKPIPAAHASVTVHRTKNGDTPDYVCAGTSVPVCLSEAKGSQNRINFKRRAISWREQFSRIEVLNSQGQPVGMKGYLSALQLVTGNKIDSSRLWVEDPETQGDVDLGEEDLLLLRRSVMLTHYAGVLELAGLGTVARALVSDDSMGQEFRIPIAVWRCRSSALTGTTFVSGAWPFFSLPDRDLLLFRHLTRHDVPLPPGGLDASVFFAIEQTRARNLAKVARGDLDVVRVMEDFVVPGQLPDGLSILRDGSILGTIYDFAIEGLDYI
jgi:hypothetical protein